MVQLPKVLHHSQYRVYYEDTDAGGVVYHANYLRFMERARTDWLDSIGLPPKSAYDDSGVVFVVRSAVLDFFAPARLNDWLGVSVELEQLGMASLDISQSIMRNAERISCGRLRIACVDPKTMRVCRVPGELSDRLMKWKT